MLALGLVGSGVLTGSAVGQDKPADYITGVPANPSKMWMIAAGGRLYDHWMDALGKTAPEKTHPLWPASNTEKSGKDTWRCKACHGWDYLGGKGQNRSGAYKTGIIGVDRVAGKDPKYIVSLFSDSKHGFTDQLIPSEARLWLAMFLSQGQHKTRSYISDSGRVRGSLSRGEALFQNVCAACHGYDGRTLSWGDPKSPAYVGTEANANPWEVLHKMRNGHPGHNMVALRALRMDDLAAILRYAQSLPQK